MEPHNLFPAFYYYPIKPFHDCGNPEMTNLLPMLEVKMVICEYLSLTFDPLTLICVVVFDTVKTPRVHKYPYQI